MPAKNPLQRLAVKSPCSQDWNSMIGNDRVRFCEHCSLHVHNISEMTRAEALRLAHRSNGRLCVRYLTNAQDSIVTRIPGSQRIYQIGRRVSRLASGAFGATLSVSAVFAAPAPAVHGDNGAVIQQIKSMTFIANSASLTGTVIDPNAAVIVGASIILTNVQARWELTTTTDDTGKFRFDSLAPGYYNLKVTSPGFVTFERTAMHMDGKHGVDLNVEMTLQVAMAGAVAIASPSNPLVKAAHDDNLEALQGLIDKHPNVNLRDPNSGTTALDHAVQNGNREMVQFLISKGADVNASEDGGVTALMQVNEATTPDLLWDLINAGAKINYKTEYGTTVLMTMASQSNSEVLEELLSAGADLNATDEDGMTALMIAASEGRVLNVRLLVLAGARIDATDNEGKNALMHAIANEHKAVIRFLRSRGAVEVPLKQNKEGENEEN